MTRTLLPLIGALAALSLGASRLSSQATQDCTASEHRQFDFWLGRWSVRDSSGKEIGKNTITSVQRGCALREEWTDARGNTGESLTAYDRAVRQWHQTWIDVEGNVWKIDGGLIGPRIVMERTAPGPRNPAIAVIHRWTWIPGSRDSVRQLYEVSRDTGR